MKDNPNYLGSGKINFEKVVDAIGDIGFQEWCVLETDTPARDVEGDMRINLRFISKLFKERAAVDAENGEGCPGSLTENRRTVPSEQSERGLLSMSLNY